MGDDFDAPVNGDHFWNCKVCGVLSICIIAAKRIGPPVATISYDEEENMNRSFANLLSAAVIAVGTLVLWNVPEAIASGGDECSYDSCMEYCTKEYGFHYCHSFCKKEC